MDHNHLKKYNTLFNKKSHRNSEEITNRKIFRNNIKNPFYDSENNFITTTKNINTIKDNDILELSKADKNINSFLSNYLKSYTLKERKKPKFLQSVKNIVNYHSKKGSSDLIRIKKKFQKNSNKNILKSIMNRSITNNSNEGNSQSLGCLLKRESLQNNCLIEYYDSPIDSPKLNHIDKSIFHGIKNEKKNNNNKIICKVKTNNYENYTKNELLNASKSCSSNSNFPKVIIENSGKKINKKGNFNLKQKNIDRNCQSDFMDEKYELPCLSKDIKRFSSPKNKNNYSNRKSENISSRYTVSPKNSSSERIKLKTSRSFKGTKKDNINDNGYRFSFFFNIANPKNLQYGNSFTPKATSDKIITKKKMNSNSNIGVVPQNPYLNETNKKNDKKRNIKQKIKRLSFSGLHDDEKFNLTPKINKPTNTNLVKEKLGKKNLFSILRTNKPNEIENTNKIMDIITMDEVNKKLKESIISIDKCRLKKELEELETNDICEKIAKLPVVNPNGNSKSNNKENNENSFGSFSSEDTDRDKLENIDNLSTKAKYRFCKNKSDNINSSEKWVKKKEIFRSLKHKNIIYDSLDDEEFEDVEVYSNYISPNSLTTLLLDSIILIFSLIGTFYFPIFIALKTNFCRKILDFNEIMFHFVDFLYIIDFITEFFRAYYNFDEYLVKNKADICINYLKGWFIIDLIEAIPFYTIFGIFEERCELKNNYRYSKYYNTNIHKAQYQLNIIKALKILKVSSKNTALKKINNFIDENEFLFKYKTILSTIFIVFNCINISSCIFINIGKNSNPGWITENNLQNRNFLYIYITAIYYLITTITTVGYGDICVISLTERIYQIIIVVIGTCVYSWALTYISNYIQKIQEKNLIYNQKMSILQEIKISNPYLTDDLYNKIHKHLLYNSLGSKNSNESIINCLPYPLKNSLFMEMYKPIIKNFIFFKSSFENTNFIVKVVTSFKYVLSTKGDILMEEDDFVEDVFFVKEGVISLEICIDLNYEQESIEALLNETGLGKTNIFIQKKNTNKFDSLKAPTKFDNNNYLKNSFINTITNINLNLNKNEQDIDEINKRYLKIICIRKNEHFGEILMFLNERAPLRAKVASKKAELYLLNKTDAIEISTLYPNVWKRIIKKSLYNMKQIKNLSKKILIIYSKINGIKLNNDLNDNDNLDESSGNLSKNEETKSLKPFSLFSNCYQRKNIKRRSKKGKSLNSVIYEEENENGESFGDKTVSSVFSIKKDSKNNCISNKSSKNKLQFQSSEKLKTFIGENNFILPDFNHKNERNKTFEINLKNDIYKKNFSATGPLSNNFNKKKFVQNFLQNKSSQNKKNKKCRKTSVDNLENIKMKNFKKKYEITNINSDKIKNEKCDQCQEKKDEISSQKINNTENAHLSFNSSDSDSNDNNLTPFKKKEINDEIYPNERLNSCKYLKNEFSEIEDEEKNIRSSFKVNIISDRNYSDYENSESNKNKSAHNITNDNFTFIAESSLLKKDNHKKNNILKLDVNKNSKIIDKNINIFIKGSKNEKIKTFDNLLIFNNCFMTIKSSYFNLNQFTKYKYNSNPSLQNKIKEFLLKEYHISEKSTSINNTINSHSNLSTISINKLNVLSESKYSESYFNPKKPKRNSKLKSKKFIPKIKVKNEINKNYDNSSVSNPTVKENSESKISYEKKYPKSPSLEKKKVNLDFNNSSISKKYKRNSVLHKSYKLSLNTQKNIISKNNNLELSFDTKKKVNKKKSSQYFFGESSFYGKKKSKIFNNNIIRNSVKNSGDKKKIDYLDQISQNISENKQTLENPQEFYTGFFTNIINKQKISRRKSLRMKKNYNNFDAINTKTNEEINKNKDKNNENISNSLVNNKTFIKRNSTTNESLMRSNIDFE